MKVAGAFASIFLLIIAFSAQPTSADPAVDGTWVSVKLPPNSVDIEPIRYGAAIYDPVRARMVTFGGRGNLYTQNVVSAALLEAPASWQAVPTAGYVSPRNGHVMVYDSKRDRLVLWGGEQDSNNPAPKDPMVLNLDGVPTWSTLIIGGPGVRTGSCAVYDPVGDRVLIFGGGSSGAIYQDVWELRLAGTPIWNSLIPNGSGPQARTFAGATYDPVGRRMLIFGGNGASGRLGDTWALDLGDTLAWDSLATVGVPPSPRMAAGVCYDPVRQRMIVTCGDDGTLRNDAFALSLGNEPTWTSLAPAGTAPQSRSGATLVYDPVGDRAVLWSGIVGTNTFTSDLWGLSLAGAPAWAPIVVYHNPGPRWMHGGAYDPIGGRNVFYGGSDGVSIRREVWSLRFTPPGAVWNYERMQDLPPQSPHTTALRALTAYSAVDAALVVFAGTDGATEGSWASGYRLDTRRWFGVGPGGVVTGREATAGFWDNDLSRLVFFGGRIGATPLGDLWQLAGSGWQQLNPAFAGPSPRSGHSMVFDPPNRKAYIFGGSNGSQLFSDVWQVDFFRNTWTKLTPAGLGPSARAKHGSFFDPLRHRMIVFGGRDSLGLRNDVFALDVTVDPPVWSELHPAGTPPRPREEFAADYDAAHDCLVVYGGLAQPVEVLSDVWGLTWGDPSTAARASLVESSTTPGEARLVWFAPGGAGQVGTIERCSEDSEHVPVQTLVSDASGRFVLVDRVSVPGRYGYRLGLRGENGEQEYTADEWIVIPSGVRFGFRETGSNPTRGALRIAFELESTSQGALDLFDVSGRRLRHVDLTSMGPGTHEVDLSPESAMPPGIYFVRLVQGTRMAVHKVVFVD